MLRHAASCAARTALPLRSVTASGARGLAAPTAAPLAGARTAPAVKTVNLWAQMRETPLVLGNIGELEALQMLNRNARKPKKANHGKRPCSHVGRRERRRKVKT